MKAFLISSALRIASVTATIGMVEFDHYGATVYIWAYKTTMLLLLISCILISMIAIANNVNRYEKNLYDGLRSGGIRRGLSVALGFGMAGYMLINNFAIIGVLQLLCMAVYFVNRSLSLTFGLKEEE